MLIYLSRVAHEKAVAEGLLVPAERYEFMHLPMTWDGDVPVFDPARMRPDQIEETVARLEQITGRVRAVGVKDQVVAVMAQFGGLGLRLSDIRDEVSASKPAVLKYLRQLEEEGRVRVTEETTRGDGSKRKRYWWIAAERQFDVGEIQFEDVELSLRADVVSQAASTGIVFHGTSAGGLGGCGCSACSAAVEVMLEEEARSAARRSGGNQLLPGLELRRVRRERQEAEDRAVISAAGLAAT